MKYILSKTILFLSVLFVLSGFAFAGSGQADASLPDSIVNEDHIYKYLYTDRSKSEQIMQEMRLRRICPVWKLDYIEGDLNYNTGRYHKALKHYKAALGSKHVKKNDTLRLELLHRQVSCYDGLHDETHKMRCIKAMIQLAQKLQDKPLESIAVFNMGKSLHEQGDKEQGYRYMEQGAAMMDESDYRLKYDNLRYEYKTLAMRYQRDERHEDVLRILDEWEKVVSASTGGEPAIDGLAESERKDLLAIRTVALSRMGHPAEAAACYREFRLLDKNLGRNNYLIMPYLFDTEQYDEIFRINLLRERFLKEQNDTVNYYMASILKFLGYAYRDVGQHHRSSDYFERLSVLRDSLKEREQQSATLELAEEYQTNELEAENKEHEHTIRTRTLVAGFAAVLLGIALVFIVRISRDARIIRRKNEAMTGTIDELMTYKNELFIRQEEIIRLQDELQQCRSAQLKPQPLDAGAAEPEQPVEMQESVMEAEEDVEADIAPAIELTENDRALYDRISHEIISRKLYLRSGFNKSELMKEIHVPANKFAALFRKFAGRSFSQYMKDRQMDYAIRMMREHPEWSMEAVAKEARMSKATFYRQFQEKYGMIPSNYIKKEPFTPPLLKRLIINTLKMKSDFLRHLK